MQDLGREIAAFREAREQAGEVARQTVALQLLCGVDLAEALRGTGAARERTIRRIMRAMERERLKGARGSVGYDLDRHIALKRSLDRLVGTSRRNRPANENGARRRRCGSTVAV